MGDRMKVSDIVADPSVLGIGADQTDVSLFALAVQLVMNSGLRKDEESAVAFVWNDGDWMPRMAAIIDDAAYGSFGEEEEDQ
jgi:hypothetical protein